MARAAHRCLALCAVATLTVPLIAPPTAAVKVGNVAIESVYAAQNPCAELRRLTWTLPVTPPASGISAIRVYRNGALMSSKEAGAIFYLTSEGRELPGPGETHSYEVAVVNGLGSEEPERASLLFTAPPCAPPEPVLRTLALVLDFEDQPAPPTLDIDDLRYVLFEAPVSVSRLLEVASYGQSQIQGTVAPVIRMPRTFASYSASSGSLSPNEAVVDALKAAAYVVAGLANYDRYLFYFTRTNRGGWAVGAETTTVQGPVRAVGFADNIQSDLSWAYPAGSKGMTFTAAHELGHNLAMRHSGMWNCPGQNPVGPSLTNLVAGNCTIAQYVDKYGIMGAAWLDFPEEKVRDYTAYHKLLAGYIGLDQVQTVALSSLTTQGTAYWIDQIEKPSGGTKLLRVDLGNGAYYLIENRHQGQNQFFGEIDRVIVRLKPGVDTVHPQGEQVYVDSFGLQRDGEQLFLNAVHPSFVDSYRKVMVSVVETRSQSGVHQARVSVQRPLGGCGMLGAEVLPLIAALSRARRRSSRRAPGPAPRD